MKDKLKEVLAQVAPTVATALGGPLAGAALGSLLKVFGVTNEDDLEAAITRASPDQLIALKTLELEYQKLLQMDTQSAREMQIAALNQDDRFSKRFVYVFASCWSLFSIAYIFAITFMDIPKENVRFADTTLGFLLGTIIATIVQYFYGSSMGSKLKDEMKNEK